MSRKPLDVFGNRGHAEWIATAKQTADIVIAELRQFWYEVELLEGLGLLAVE
jgi:hypothetical protein